MKSVEPKYIRGQNSLFPSIIETKTHNGQGNGLFHWFVFFKLFCWVTIQKQCLIFTDSFYFIRTFVSFKLFPWVYLLTKGDREFYPCVYCTHPCTHFSLICDISSDSSYYYHTCSWCCWTMWSCSAFSSFTFCLSQPQHSSMCWGEEL